MIAQFLILIVFPALLLAAAGWDAVSYTIPNFIPAAFVLTFAALALLIGLSPMQIGWHVLAGGAGLAAGFTLYSFGLIGGGDAKLFASIALLLGVHDAFTYALAAALFGGGLTIGLMLMRHVPVPQFLAYPWLLRLHDTNKGVPYGVALAGGAFVLLPYTEIFRLCAHG